MWTSILVTAVVAVEYVLKIIAIGTVPENRRPSSSHAWLLLILFLPAVGFPLYWLIGSPYVRGRRALVQDEVNKALVAHTRHEPSIPEGVDPDPQLTGLLNMNQRLTGLRCVTGSNLGLYPDTVEFYEAMAESIDRAHSYVHLEFYIMAWDGTTDVLFSALARARARGVRVRVLLDHLGSRKYPGWRTFTRRLTEAKLDWHLMMPLLPLQGRWRRPDLRNHRKLMVVDGVEAYMGSHNLIETTYGNRRNERIGRTWKDLSVKVSGTIIRQLDAIFAADWYAETDEDLRDYGAPHYVETEPETAEPMQLVPSGPGHPTEPNRQQFVQLIHMANHRITITSPYFVPDEALMTAIAGAAYRGVEIELFVGEKADQFLVGHAQRSYYRALLEAGVRIYLYPAPTVLHSKYMTVDDHIAVVGSSNMDFRSFALSYEIMLLTFGGTLVADLVANDADYRAVSHELTLEEWLKQPFYSRYIDNVCRLTSALM